MQSFISILIMLTLWRVGGRAQKLSSRVRVRATKEKLSTLAHAHASAEPADAMRAIASFLLAQSLCNVRFFSSIRKPWIASSHEPVADTGLPSIARPHPMMENGHSARERVVLITGANKGIGKEIVRKLASLPNHVVILGCRDVELGTKAAAEFQGLGYDAVFAHLDLTNRSSIEAAHDFIKQRYGKLDALVNNAAICFNDPTLYGRVSHTPFEQQACMTMETNYFGTLHMIQTMLPLLRLSDLSPRIVNVASWAGRLRGSPELQAMFTSPSLDIPQLSELMDKFVKDAESGVHTENGWPNTCYGVSKLGVIALTRVLAREEQGIMINSADPGYCATDQNNNQGYISAEEGAVTPSLLAYSDFTDGQFLSGKHFYEGREISWSYQ